ncbi:sperm acrosome-associated protein 9 isoform X3 [Balaenoptera acutorostrata]|uniref:Sperm acrosome-associated protein 9 isoform X3 n=1 Tax=Balaenoptera acutorostrata TaxID=9767 RepID=A0A384B463_BALAC|nr:sperm acrosome-associated protein 9 isoform X3 [Balaenoptera acutorostrata]
MKTLSRCGAGCLKKEGRRVEGPVGNPQPSLHLLSPRDPATCSRGGAGLPRDPIAMAPAVTIRPAAPPLLTSDLPTPPTPSPKPWEGPPRPSGAPDTHGDAPASGHSIKKCLHPAPFIQTNLAAVTLVQGTITLDSLLQLLSRYSWCACHKSIGSRTKSVLLSGALGATSQETPSFRSCCVRMLRETQQKASLLSTCDLAGSLDVFSAPPPQCSGSFHLQHPTGALPQCSLL